MAIDFLNPSARKNILDEIRGKENKNRKAESLKQFEILSDRQHQYVVEYLREQFSQKTVKEMPVISSINLAKRITTKEASLYADKPTRIFTTESEAEIEQINALYAAMGFDSKMLKANQVFKLQGQVHLMFVPKGGKLVCRVLMGHHVDVIPSETDPEVAEAYIISSMDKSEFMSNSTDQSLNNPSGYTPQSGSQYRDGINQKTADADDYKASLERYAVWTKELNFVMDGNGKILSDVETIVSPLAEYGIMPFVDIANEKDFEYFVRAGSSVTDFSIQYCGALSDLANVVKMQGWGQAFLKGSKELMPENIQIGPNFILKLPIDPNDKVETEFGFANASPDLAGSIQYIEMILSSFLTSRGLDASVVSGKGQSEKFSSGVERLLSMIQRFEASKSDMEIFRGAEEKSFEIIKAWNNILRGSDLIAADLQIAEIAEETKVVVKYKEPQMIQSRGEQLDSIMKERELGLKSRIDALMELNGIDRDAALKMAEEIDKDELIINGQDQGTQTNGIGSQSNS